MDTLNEILKHPAVLAAVAALLGIVSYSYQAHRTRLAAEHERRRQLYEALIENVFRLLDAHPGREASSVMTSIEHSWLFASDDVLRACYRIIRIYGGTADPSDPGSGIVNNPKAKTEFAKAVASLFVAMRKDLMPTRRTAIEEAWARKVIEIYEWGAPHRQETDPAGNRD